MSNLSALQSLIDIWIRANGGYWTPFQILARLIEELGEVASALQRQEGLRPRKVAVDFKGEVGDLLFRLIAFANMNGIDLEHAIAKTIEKCDIRDSEDWQTLTQNATKEQDPT